MLVDSSSEEKQQISSLQREMAYAAVISLKNTLRRLSSSSQISTILQQTIDFAYKELESLQKVLERLDNNFRSSRDRLGALDAQIREAVFNLENVVDGRTVLIMDDNGVDFITQEVNSFSKEMKRMKEEYLRELDTEEDSVVQPSSVQEVDAEENGVVSFSSIRELDKEEKLIVLSSASIQEPDTERDGVVSSSSGGNKSHFNNFGLSDDKIRQLKHHLTARKPYEIYVVIVFGKAGTGRSIMANYAFHHPSLRRHFPKRAWVSVGPQYRLKEIVIGLLFQVVGDPSNQGNYKVFSEEAEEEDEKYLGHLLYEKLKGSRYLLALDNLCDNEVWDCLKSFFPEEFNGSRVLLTTNVRELVALSAGWPEVGVHEMKVVDEEESWDLLCKLVFGDQGPCPGPNPDEKRTADICRGSLTNFLVKLVSCDQAPCPSPSADSNIEKAGKRIAKSCQGCLVEITKVARFLSKDEKTPEIWSNVAEDRENFTFTDAYDELSEISRTIEELELGNSFCGGDDDFYASTDFGRVLYEMPELYDVVEKIVKDLVIVDHNLPRLHEIFSLIGMAGIGKTTLAKKVFEDLSTLRCFDYHVWVTLGPKYRPEKILVDILTQIDPDIDEIHMKGEEMLVKHFCTKLSSKKCLILLDDVWNKEVLLYLKRLPSDIIFEVLLTTRLQTLAPQSDKVYEMCFLSKEESWRLLCETVFGEKSCPFELEEVGKIIAENCEGLPLLIVTVANLLSEGDKTLEFWDKVAKKKNSLFERAYDKIMNVLLSSYEYLPQHLKACFLYMAVFPEKYEISSSKLFKLWYSEGILEPSSLESLGDLSMKYLKELVSNSLVMVLEEMSYLRINTSSLHCVFWHLCVRQARKSKFFHVLIRVTDVQEEYMENQRRLCIQNNVLFSIKDVCTSLASIPTARSLLCAGKPHQYPVPICFGLGLLKVLEALTIRLYEFPIKVINLILLRHLALSCDRELPPSISKLKNLESLIIHRQIITIVHGSPLYLPKQIWDLKELKHLQVMGSTLPDPCGSVLPNLLTLLDMSTHSCTKGVLQGTLHLRELGIRIEQGPDEFKSFFSFDHISHLNELESLECISVNPEHRLEIVPPPASLSMLPLGLKELSLSGLGYPWKYIKTIASLPNLEVLILRGYSFCGPEWVMHKGEFKKLRYFLLEDTDLVRWRDDERIIWFWCITLRHCYKLKDIPRLDWVSKIDIVDCNPSICKEIPSLCLAEKIAHIHSSWK